MKSSHYLITSLLFLGFAPNALAKKDQREGLNFGLGLHFSNGDDKSLAGDETTKDSHKKSAVQSVSPYLGYVFFDTINLGINGLFEQASAEETQTTKADNRKNKRTSDSTLKSGGLFLRFLFAKFMYFEGGMGIYDRRLHVQNEYTSDGGDGIFTGQREEYTVHGIGPGYHLGAGIEVAVINGFYFTTNYLVRSFTLRDKSSGSIGKKRARVEQRELTFGLAHYVD